MIVDVAASLSTAIKSQAATKLKYFTFVFNPLVAKLKDPICVLKCIRKTHHIPKC